MKINKCFFGLHKWSKWEMVEATYNSFFTSDTYDVIAQKRVCEDCGRIDIEKI
jgi:uncharacterized protein YdaU (DUF1376 family)